MEKKIKNTLSLPRRTWLWAMLVIIIILTFGLLFLMPEKVSAQKGGTFFLTLPDSTEVILYNGATATYNSRNWDSNREVQLKGEAYFKVAKGKTFTVTTPQGIVTVLGTKFKVKSAGSYFGVSCYEGKVSVICKKREFILTSQQGITFTDDNDTGVQEVKEPQPLWLSQQLFFF